MSLEAVIQENTQVMRELIARLTASNITSVQMSGSAYIATLDAKEAKAETKSETKTETKASAKADTKEDAAAIDYEKDVRPLLVKISTTKGRDALVELLAQFKATKGDQLKPADFPNVLIAARDVLAA